jgi:ApbE superfamily uncharacterized protein (UPF0280 family)
MKYGERFYRQFPENGRWKAFRVRVETSDLYIRAKKDLTEAARQHLIHLRTHIRDHIARQECFMTSLRPVERLPQCPDIINRMYAASEESGAGPMASVAGAIAESLGMEILKESEEVIVENGGDLWISVQEPVTINILTESIYFADRINLLLRPHLSPCGIATSSAKTGPSLSLGKADSATVLCADAALADATATGACNLVTGENSLDAALDYCFSIKKTLGALIMYRDTMALKGDLELTRP